MGKRARGFQIAALVGALELVGTFHASAQEATLPGASAEVEEIVVLARRRAENIQDVPSSVSALPTEALERLAVKSTLDLTKVSPGLQVDAPSGTRAGRFTIRGQGTSFGASPGVVAYFAEVPDFSPNAFFDLDSIQVLAGPQGTLFGRNTTGGAVLFVPRRPDGEFDGYVRAAGGNYRFRELEGAVGGAVIPEKVFVRLAGQLRRRDGFTTNLWAGATSNRDLDDIDNTFWRVSVLLRPVESVESTFIYAGSYLKTNGVGRVLHDIRNLCQVSPNPPGTRQGAAGAITAARPNCSSPTQALVPTATQLSSALLTNPNNRTWFELLQEQLALQQSVGVRATFADFDNRARSKTMGVINTTAWDITDGLTLKNIASYREIKTANGYGVNGGGGNNDGSQLPILNSISALGTSIDAYRLGGQNLTPRTYTEEIQLVGKAFDDKLDYILGYYYENSPFGGFLVTRSQTFGNVAINANAVRSKSNSKAVYSQATFALTDALNVGSSRVDLQACKLEYSIVSPK